MAQEYNRLVMAEAEWIAECVKILKEKYGNYDPYFIAQQKPLYGWKFIVHASRDGYHHEIKIDLNRPEESTVTVICKDTKKG